jgi:hypothetical protein
VRGAVSLQNIYRTLYKNVTAIALETDLVRVLFLPENGGKLASIVQKNTSREFLVQAPGLDYKELAYDGDYVESECSGFDDMFPTIDRCFYTDHPWKGIEMPDHGEVCALKWHYEIQEHCLYMYVYGVRFPYKLEKWVNFAEGSSLNIRYKATNLSGFDFNYIWAAHPMIQMEEGGEIIVPFMGGEPVVSMYSSDINVHYGDNFSWPNITAWDGIDETGGRVNPDNKRGYKFFFKHQIPEGWCAYQYSDGTIFRFSFPKENVPYLGVWVNESEFKNCSSVALEMCTGSYDRPDVAKKIGQHCMLPAKADCSWHLNIDIT